MSLCLACACVPDAQAYSTTCCSLPICTECTSRNPRLIEYDPCLRCVAKVDAPPVYDAAGDVGGVAEGEGEGVVFEHTVRRGETLRSIAQRYGVDPHELLKLNNLPPAALITNPTIVQTRRTLQISSQPSPARELKRFQIVTKTADPAIGKVYMDLGGVERYFEDEEWENRGGAKRERVKEGKWVGVRGNRSFGAGGEKVDSGDSKEKY